MGGHYWPLDNDAIDILSNWNGVVKSGVKFTSKSTFGSNKDTNVATFDGTANSYIDLPDITHGSGAYSICGWAKQNGMNNWQRIVDFGRGAGNNNILVANEGRSRHLIWEVHGTRSSVQRCKSNNFWTNNVWTHFCVTMSADTSKKIYKNGNLVQTCTNRNAEAGLPETTRHNAYIGKSNWNDALYKGQMARLMIMDGTEITAQHAKKLFSGVKPVVRDVAEKWNDLRPLINGNALQVNNIKEELSNEVSGLNSRIDRVEVSLTDKIGFAQTQVSYLKVGQSKVSTNGLHYWPLDTDAKDMYSNWNGVVKSGVK